MHDICEVCGNDDASLALCTDCLAPKPAGIARIIASPVTGLGGEPDDYTWLAENIAEDLGWCRPD